MKTYKLGEGEVLLQLNKDELAIITMLISRTSTTEGTQTRDIIWGIWNTIRYEGFVSGNTIYEKYSGICKTNVIDMTTPK